MQSDRFTIKEVLAKTDHRPWTLPLGNWRYYQEWNDALFLHWRVSNSTLRKLVPAELEIDTFDGDAWISIVAFDMRRIRPRSVPAFPPISNFHEVNIRTYVRYNDKPGVYFLSIEGGTKVSCAVAKKLSGLPYRYSRIQRTTCFYGSENPGFGDRLQLTYRIGEPISAKSDLDQWLTERYALFQDTSTTTIAYEIHHLPWPLFELKLEALEVCYQRFKELLHETPAICHYSPGVQVLAWS